MSPGDGRAAVGFLFDLNRCTGCNACELACSTENELGWGRSWREVVPFNPERQPGMPSFHLSVACHHCEEAPCLSQCPTLAITRDPETGAVLVDEGRCIGCRYCSWVCPYDVPRFDESSSVMTKCTSCNHRLHEGKEPACVEACPTAALGWGPLEGDPTVRGFPTANVGARIRFTPLRRDAERAASTWELPAEVAEFYGSTSRGVVAGAADSLADANPSAAALAGTGVPTRVGQTSLRSEAPLWLFTTGAAGLVGWILAAARGAVAVNPFVFASLAAVTLALSTFHLGRPLRAWRAISNLRRSRLSREIGAYGAFLGGGVLMLIRGGQPPAALALLTGVLGLIALFSMDRVYDPVRPAGGGRLHSADVVLTGPLFASVLLHATGAFMVLASIKLILYARDAMRARRSPGAGGSAGPGARSGVTRVVVVRGVLRVGVGLILPPLLWSLWPGLWPGWAALSVAAGELLDRAEFYQGLEISPPLVAHHRSAA